MNDSDRKNPRRLIRKIEIARFFRTHRQPVAENEDYANVCTCGLTASRFCIKERIEKRVEKRMQEGALEEVKKLVAQGYDWSLPSMSALGYREWKEFSLWKKDGLDEQKIIEQWIKDEIGYAKRQMVWFRKQQDIVWFDAGKDDVNTEASHFVEKWYNMNR